MMYYYYYYYYYTLFVVLEYTRVSRCFVQSVCDIIMTKKMLTHTPRNKNERKSKRTKHTRIFSFCFEISAKFCIQWSCTKKPKRGEKKLSTLLEVFLAISSFFIIALFFLSFSAATSKNSFFFSRATERERERERKKERDWERRKCSLIIRFIYTGIKGRRRWKFFFNDSSFLTDRYDDDDDDDDFEQRRRGGVENCASAAAAQTSDTHHHYHHL